MPKSTFFNLPVEKRKRITEVAIKEFAKHTYHKASISRIVENAEIAKGSFYQYFDNKRDLFKYIIQVSGEKKMAYLNFSLEDMTNMNFFDTVRELYASGIKFGNDNPNLSAIAHNFMKGTDEDFKKEILGESVPKSNELFKQLLKQGITKGEIKPDIDVELVSYMLTSLSTSIGEYFFKEKKVADDMEIMKFVDEMLFVFKEGIQT